MALKDMSLTAEEAKEQDCCAPSTTDAKDTGPKYPWGLRLDLDDGSLEKLGIGLMPMGTEFMITAKARVVSSSSYEREGGDAEQSLGVQIVAMDMGVPQADRTAKSAAKLYPNASKETS
jgi:hypothetical protein